ncbi:uncharacterized protein YuzE [Microbacterium natoriense]|uniref:Uncharacterized protein YuzE n=1 Tax=Microbacterium natoriense TaxID=284570 RepID=A0AAW8EUV0_9MICO|nr:uncharacterized protein YuzE [Microbacterium natoriense]
MTRALNFEYDPESDAAYIRLRSAPIDHTVDLEQVALQLPVLVDIDSDGRVLGFEILSVSTTVGPQA